VREAAAWHDARDSSAGRDGGRYAAEEGLLLRRGQPPESVCPGTYVGDKAKVAYVLLFGVARGAPEDDQICCFSFSFLSLLKPFLAISRQRHTPPTANLPLLSAPV